MERVNRFIYEFVYEWIVFLARITHFQYIKESIVPEFFKHLWTRRTAGDRYAGKILVETTNEIAQRVGIVFIDTYF